MAKFRKKPIVVEAEQFDHENKPWPDGVYEMEMHGFLDWGFRIQTIDGVQRVTPGDWIITGIQGEKYACKPDIFEETYEPI